MGTRGTVGRIALGLSAGTVAALAGIKLLDDRYVDKIWRTLERSRSDGEPFREEMVAGLPDPARRYFLHSIRPGTPLASRLHWGYSASMRPGRQLPWMEISCEQILVKERGFVWKARGGKGPLTLTAADFYLDGEGRMRIALFGLLPVVNATGPDLSRSALARLLMEGVGLPSAFLPGPHVRIDGVDDSRFTVTASLYGEETPITLTVDQDGRPTEFVMQRWGNLTEDGSYRYIPYGGTMRGELPTGGYTIPAEMAGGWWYGTEQYLEVIRLSINWAWLD